MGVKAPTVTGAAVAEARANRGPRARLLARQAIRRVATKHATSLDPASKGVAGKRAAVLRDAAIKRVAIKRVAIKVAAIKVAVRVASPGAEAEADAGAMTDAIEIATTATAATNR